MTLPLSDGHGNNLCILVLFLGMSHCKQLKNPLEAGQDVKFHICRRRSFSSLHLGFHPFPLLPLPKTPRTPLEMGQDMKLHVNRRRSLFSLNLVSRSFPLLPLENHQGEIFHAYVTIYHVSFNGGARFCIFLAHLTTSKC